MSASDVMPLPRASISKYKLLLLGDAGVGKTSLSRRFVEGEFQPSYVHTIGIDFMERLISIGDDQIRLQIWDTAGQDRFRTLIRPYYRGASGIVLVYDVTDYKTFLSIEEWMRAVEENANFGQVIEKVLVGNKVDLSERQVTTLQGEHLAKRYGCVFAEASAKSGQNVDGSFMDLAQSIYDQKGLQLNFPNPQFERGLELDVIPVHSKSNKKCCSS